MKSLIITGLLLAVLLTVQAQLTVTVPTITATPGQTVNLPVKLYGAGSSGIPITGCEIYINFNNAVLTSGSLVNFYSVLPSPQWIFSVNQGNNGIVAANWVSPNYLPVAIPDGTTLFEIQFTYIGGTSPLVFDANTFFLDLNFEFVTTTMVNGSVGPPMPIAYVWTGATSNNWTVSTNWNPVRTTPAVTDILQFNTAGTSSVTGVPTETIGQLILSNNTTVNLAASTAVSLNVGGGTGTDLAVPGGSALNLGGPNPAFPVSLTLNSGTTSMIRGFLTVSGSLTNNAGNAGMVIQCDISGSGSLLNTGVITGGATVERFLPANTWHYISSPISNGTIGIFLDDYLRTSDPTTVNGWGPYLQQPTTSLLEVGRGYSAWLPATTETKTFTGNLNTGNVSISFSRNPTDPHAGWHMAGNPYPSAINLASAGINWGNFEQTAWFWNGTQYETYPALSGFGTHSQYVPPVQGFFAHIVASYSGSTSITFNNTARTHNTSSYLKETASNVLALSVTGTQNAYSDKAVVHIMDATTPDYDPGYDAKKFYGISEAPQIYSILPSEIAAVNVLPWAGKNTIVPLGFKSGISDTYSISFSETQSFTGGVKIVLEDLKENKSQDIVANPVYSFNYAENEEPARFVLHFQNPNIGVDEHKDAALSVYSFEQNIYVRNTGKDQLQGDLYVIDLVGRQVFHSKLNDMVLQKFNAGVPHGYYLVHLVTNQYVMNQKVFLN